MNFISVALRQTTCPRLFTRQRSGHEGLKFVTTESLDYRVTSRFFKIIWEQTALPPLATKPLITAAHNRLTVFARWRQCARPSNTRFLQPTPLILTTALSSWPLFHNTRSLPTDRPTGRIGNSTSKNRQLYTLLDGLTMAHFNSSKQESTHVQIQPVDRMAETLCWPRLTASTNQRQLCGHVILGQMDRYVAFAAIDASPNSIYFPSPPSRISV